MSWTSTTLGVLAVGSAAGVLTLLVRRTSGQAAGWMKPLLGGMACLNGIGLIVLIQSGLARDPHFSAPGWSLAAGTAILALKFGWLWLFLSFFRRFAFPAENKRLHRAAIAAAGLVLALALAGWIEFFSSSRRGLFDRLQAYSDYFVFFATIGTALALRARAAGSMRGPAAKALAGLGGLCSSFFLGLGIWWIVGESVVRLSPSFGQAFFPLLILLFNGSVAVWTVRYSKVLGSPETARLSVFRLAEDRLSRWGISDRERQVIELVGLGLSNGEISRRLFISLSTVKKHLNNIFAKTGVDNRVKLVRMFSESGTGQEREPGGNDLPRDSG